MKIYTFNYATASVVERECKEFGVGLGWTAKDSAGATMYDNTHFKTHAEALAKLRREVEASLEMGARERQRLRQALADVTSELADDAERLVKIAGVEAKAPSGAGPPHPGLDFGSSEAERCGACFRCLDNGEPWRNPARQQMITCKDCGNKRCPRAQFHGNVCSRSNDPAANEEPAT